jgi:hypothetical protein
MVAQSAAIGAPSMGDDGATTEVSEAVTVLSRSAHSWLPLASANGCQQSTSPKTRQPN